MSRRGFVVASTACALALAALGSAPSRAADVTVTIDPYGSRRPIEPLVYGVNFADTARLATVPYPLNRWGGNSVTRYNWRVDVHNTASDWFFMNVPDTPLDVGQLPLGSSADQFITGTLAGGAEPLLTVPTIGYTPRWQGLTTDQARDKRWGFSRAAYAAQGTQDWDECLAACGFPSCNNWCMNDAGNGCLQGGNANVHCDSGFVVDNNAADTSDAIGTGFVTDWMAHVIGQVGTASNGGLRFYALDNEPNLWNSTHRDVHPAPLSYDELWDLRTVPYAAAIKAADPAAKILGPDSWGWCDYFTSALDAAVGPSCVDGADRQNHGGLPLLEWYLEQVCDYEAQNGVRLVDYLDIHFYPQGECVSGLGWSAGGLDCGSAANDGAFAAARLRALKELYDPDWISESWIGAVGEPPIQLLPRMKQWIAARCPALGLAVTEYKWGSDNGVSGALAQAEVLALFGREGVDLATRWVAPAAGSRSEDAFRFFLDYDLDPANGFQQVSGDSGRVVQTAGTPDHVGVYAVHGPGGASNGQLFVLLFNHQTTSANATVSFALPVAGPAALWRFNPAAAAPRITNVGTAAVTANGMALAAPLALPARTATLAIVGLPFGLPFSDGFETGTTAKWAH
jgi:hypothetical protein